METTGQESLSYIGFSQGTAQAFAALAIHPKLNDKVNVFIALAPAMSPAGLFNGVVDALVKASPQVLFLLFGRRSILSSTTMWQSILYPPIFVKIIDYSLSFLFNWQTKNITSRQKLAAYPHLYSFTSTKSVVHWFQIIRNKAFQMYDDDVQHPVALSSSSKYTKVARYPTRNIKTPIVLVYGGTDSLVDIKAMLRELPKKTVATEIPHYEHLDFLWAHDVDVQVFPHVFDALHSFTEPRHPPEEYVRYQLARQESLLGSGTPYRDQPETSGWSGSDTSTTEAWSGGAPGDEVLGLASNDMGFALRPRTPQHKAREGERDDVVSLDTSPVTGRPHTANDQRRLRSRGDVQDTHEVPSPGKLKGTGVRRSSGSGSILSLDTGRGIRLGTGRAVGGVVTTGGVDKGITTSPTAPEDKSKRKLKRT